MSQNAFSNFIQQMNLETAPSPSDNESDTRDVLNDTGFELDFGADALYFSGDTMFYDDDATDLAADDDVM